MQIATNDLLTSSRVADSKREDNNSTLYGKVDYGMKKSEFALFLTINKMLNTTPAHNGYPSHAPKRLRLVICGAGLGGSGAAIALRRKGHEVVVLEATSKTPRDWSPTKSHQTALAFLKRTVLETSCASR